MPSRRPEKTSTASWMTVLALVGASLAVGKRTNCENSLTSCGERGDFAFDQARAFLRQAREFGIERIGDFAWSAAIEEAREALRGKLNRGERIFDFVRDAAGDFLPRGGFLRAQHFGEVVEHENEAGVGAARAERADGDGEVKDAAGDDGFDFARDDAHAQAAAHEQLDGARGFGAEQIFERFDIARAAAEHARDGGSFRAGCGLRSRAR